METVVVSPDSHPKGGMLNAHPSQWRCVRLDKVSQGIRLFQPRLSSMSAYRVPGSRLGLETQLRETQGLPLRDTQSKEEAGYTDRAL